MLQKTLKSLFDSHKEVSLFGRYIHQESLTPLLNKLDKKFNVEVVGQSVNAIPIYTVTFGSGNKKILMWSQMHGNESTTTKAVFDFLNAISEEKNTLNSILEQCTIKIIPILNPDGAKAYTRFNAHGVDLNRDAQDLSQPESKVLREVFNAFNPDYCYNLHGQRTIFSAGGHRKPATVSFLAPAEDEDCTITETRKIAMEIIAKMNTNLQSQIKGMVGIYDDAFNSNCVGDTFQATQTPTILFEAGHYPDDYNREKVRELIFQSLLVSLSYISKHSISGMGYKPYLDIPQNEKLFYDILIKNTNGFDIAIQYQEVLVGKDIKFIPKIEKISNLSNFFGHKEIDANGYEVFGENNRRLEVGNEIDFVIINNEKFTLIL